MVESCPVTRSSALPRCCFFIGSSMGPRHEFLDQRMAVDVARSLAQCTNAHR
jgi:hypothetical protein